MEAVRRSSDEELCGHVEQRDGEWCALTVFGGELGRHSRREDAVDHVLTEGLASLADRWTLRARDGHEEIVCIQEVNPASITLALGYYSLPGVPTLTITAGELAAGDWSLHR